MYTLEKDKSISSLNWDGATYPLNEFLEEFGVPYLVCVKEGHYGMEETSSFEINQLVMLHTIRSKHKLMGEDSTGRPIAIPLDCENQVFVCPSPGYCIYERIIAAQMPHVFPNVVYFRVLENRWNKRRALSPGSILEIERIDSENSFVKFHDVSEVLPFNSRVVFEPLMDYREYTLKRVAHMFGLPATVRFLTDADAEEYEMEKQGENLISNLGRVTVLHDSSLDETVVVTKIDGDSSTPSIKNCSLISKDFEIKVCGPRNLNDPGYQSVVRKLNRAFLNRYDLTELDQLDQYEYLDTPRENVRAVLGSKASVDIARPELPPRNVASVKAPPVPQRKSLQLHERSAVIETARETEPNSRIGKRTESVEQYKESALKGLDVGNHVYDSIDESVFDGAKVERVVPELPARDVPCFRVPPPKPLGKSEKRIMTSVGTVKQSTGKRENLWSFVQKAESVAEYEVMPTESTADEYEDVSTESRTDEYEDVIVKGHDVWKYENQAEKIPEGKDETEDEYEEVEAPRSSHVTVTSEDGDEYCMMSRHQLPEPASSSGCQNNDSSKSNSESFRVPSNLSVLSVAGVGRLLRRLNMECYVTRFCEEQVDGAILVELDEKAMLSLDLMPFHVRKLMKVIQGWRPNLNVGNDRLQYDSDEYLTPTGI